MTKVVVTGAAGLIGWHASARLHAANCAAGFRKQPKPYDLVCVDHSQYCDAAYLSNAMQGADAVLHFAGINRGSDDEVERGNPAIAAQLIEACRASGTSPHIVYANSIHHESDTPYGRSKRLAGEMLEAVAGRFTNLVLPHIFGECARPHYNNVTATFIDDVVTGKVSAINPDGRLSLLHAGVAADAAITSVRDEQTGLLKPDARLIGVPELFAKISGFQAAYLEGIYPDLSDPFEIALFNSYRTALYPSSFPRPLRLNKDPRGVLFEAVKGGGGGQTFLSWTEPGVTRGDHFHLGKVERFLVLEGEAVIRIRKVLGETIWTYRVSGSSPAAVDMPTLHTHSIENVGGRPLLTLFWTNDIFNSQYPDTFADPVIGSIDG
jgi:UDP-2-acetamido-2,6-beta-L-arabino-hexul-4-ose reductase